MNQPYKSSTIVYHLNLISIISIILLPILPLSLIIIKNMVLSIYTYYI